MSGLSLLLFQIAVVLAASRVAGRALRWAGQPAVVGEMVAGLALGPSLFGLVAPGAFAIVFPEASFGAIGTLSQLGLVLFMFLVGLELDTSSLRSRGGAALLISWSSILAPFALGAALGTKLHATMAPAGVPVLAFALFIGAAMSVTAWVLLAAVVAIARASDAPSPWLVGGGALAYVAFMLTVARPLLSGLARRVRADGSLDRTSLSIILIAILVSASITELLGIHALFGAFLAGVVMPRDAGLGRALASRFEDLLSTLLLPLFFASTGLRTHFTLGGAGGQLAVLLLVLGVAIAGKMGGTTLAARWTGMSWRGSLALGTLMNTRGLMELVILNVGLDIGVLSPELFAIMVVMAVATTVMTTPLVMRLLSGAPEGAALPGNGGAPLAITP